MLRVLNPLIIAISLFLPTAAVCQGPVDEASAIDEQVIQFYRQGKFTEALPLAERSLQIRERSLGRNHAYVADSLGNLGGLHLAMGQYAKAKSLFLRALEISRKAFGENNRECAVPLNNLAAACIETGEFVTAESLFLQALDIEKKVSGEGDSGYIRSVHNLAAFYTESGQFDKAEAVCLNMLEDTKKVSGETSEGYAVALSDLARLYRIMGQYSRAEPLNLRAIDISKQALGENHPSYANRVKSLALLYMDIGQHAKAEPLLMRAIEMQKEILGDGHPDLASTMGDLAAMYCETGRYVKAESLLQQVMEAQAKQLGLHHPHYARTLNNLAAVYAGEGEFAKAELLYLQASEIWKEVLSGENPHYASGLSNLASLYQAMGRTTAAQSLHQQALELRKRVLGDKHPDYAISLINLATCYTRSGDYIKAEPLFMQAIGIVKKALGENHPTYAAVLNNLGQMYVSMAQYEKAEGLYVKAADVRKNLLGEDSVDYGESLTNLGDLYKEMHQYDKAELFTVRAKEVFKRNLGEEHPNFATSLNNLGALYDDMGQYEKSEAMLQRAVEVQKTLLGMEHPDLAGTLLNFAWHYQKVGKYEEAYTLATRASGILMKALGQDHPSYSASLNILAILQGSRQRWSEALDCAVRSMHLQQRNIRSLFRALTVTEKHAYMSTFSWRLDVLLSLVSCRLKQEPSSQGKSAWVGTALDWTMRRTGVVLDSLAAQRRSQSASTDPKIREVYSQWNQACRELARFIFNPPNISPDAFSRRKNELYEAEHQLSEQLSRMSAILPGRERQAEPCWQTVQVLLPHDGALLEFVQAPIFDFKAKGNDEHWKAARYFVFVLRGGTDQPPVMLDLGEAATIDKDISNWRQEVIRRVASSEKQSEARLSIMGQDIRKRIFDPLLPYLRGVRELLICPDGQLNLIPFGALPQHQAGVPARYLVEEYSFRYLNSGRDVIPIPHGKDGSGTVIFAAPDFNLSSDRHIQAAQTILTSLAPRSHIAILPEDSEITPNRKSRSLLIGPVQPLAGTRMEAQSVQKTLEHTSYGPVQCYIDGDALEERLKEVQAPRLLHIATHGFFLEESDIANAQFAFGRGTLLSLPSTLVPPGGKSQGPQDDPLLRSGLILAGANSAVAEGAEIDRDMQIDDGIVTALEISGLDLTGTDLVVLSACDTGVGEVKVGQGVAGLRQAFANAGAKTLVMSLYEVPDEDTCALMVDFYKRIAAGVGKTRALHEAMIAALRERRERLGCGHPYFWGAFVALGQD